MDVLTQTSVATGGNGGRHSLHEVDVGAILALAPDDSHDGADKTDADGALERVWLQLARVLQQYPPRRRQHGAKQIKRRLVRQG